MTTPTTFVPFTTDHADLMQVGSDALLFVMAHGHTISVPSQALKMAERVAVISIARRDTPAGVLRDVNKALDEINATLRTRAKLDADAAMFAALRAEFAHPKAAPVDDNPRGGQKVTGPRRPTPIAPMAGCANPF